MSFFSLKLLPLRSFALPFNLQRRDKIALTVAAAVLGLFILAQLIIFPPLDRRARLKQQILTQTRALQEMQLLSAEYRAVSQTAFNTEAQLKARPAGFTLFSFLDALAGQSGVKQNIVHMRPSTTNLKGSPYSLSLVELRIDALTMQQLVAFLHGVETSPHSIWIRRISLTRGEKEEDLINVILQAETFQL
ncbi:MAG: type II secretion system protein M [Desulfatitalea sp.]|nr:type II secretion system protein M [Desulfatitalea sp.]